MLAKSKLNSIESKTSDRLRNNEISHEDFMTILNKQKKYRELKKYWKILEWWIAKEVMLKKLVWLNKVKKIGIDKVIKRNEIINIILK